MQLFPILYVYIYIACREETLVTIEDSPEGVVITTFPARESSQQKNSKSSDQLLLKNHRLSLECGPNFERCQDLLVEYYINSTDKLRHSILFISLDGGLALVDVVRDDYTLDGTLAQHFILETNGEPAEISCSPSAMFKIINGIYAVCTNQTTNFVSIFQVYLNKTSLNSTQFSFPINDLTVPASLGNISNSTNFIHIEFLNYQYIVFALGTAFYSLRPFVYAENRLGDVLSTHCDAVHSLEYKEGLEFWAYCSNYVFKYNIGEGDWESWYALAERGISYQCSQVGVNVSVFSDYANIRGALAQTVKLHGINFSSGICFGNGSHDFFAYVDKVAGVYVVNLKNTTIRVIYESGCSDRCLPLLVVNASYLIIRGVGESRVSVLNFFQEPLELIEVVDIVPPLTGLLSLPCPPVAAHSGEGLDVLGSSGQSKSGLIGGLVGGIVILLLALVVVMAAVRISRWRKWRKYVVLCVYLFAY